jgi:twitching motility two-component system response regulator PilH
MAHVTVVNDNPEFLELVHDILEGDRYETTLIDGDRDDVLELIRSSRPDLLMIDVRLGVPGDHGWQIAQEVRREPDFAGLPVLLCSADTQELEDLESRLAETRRVATLAKPFTIDVLTSTIDDLLADRAVR